MTSEKYIIQTSRIIIYNSKVVVTFFNWYFLNCYKRCIPCWTAKSSSILQFRDFFISNFVHFLVRFVRFPKNGAFIPVSVRPTKNCGKTTVVFVVSKNSDGVVLTEFKISDAISFLIRFSRRIFHSSSFFNECWIPYLIRSLTQ